MFCRGRKKGKKADEHLGRVRREGNTVDLTQPGLVEKREVWQWSGVRKLPD